MILGVDIGGTNCDVVLYDGEFRHLLTVETEKVGVEELFLEIAEALKARGVEKGIIRAGVAVAAWIREGALIHAPNLKLERVRELERKSEFAVDDLKFEVVAVENDANCFAYFASRVFSVENLLAVTVGTGIGGGIVCDGRIVRGEGIAGEIGHISISNERLCRCGRVGCLEAHFGGWAFSEYEGILNIEKFVESGDVYETKGFGMFCRALSYAIMILNPELIVLGGRIGSRLNPEAVGEEVSKHLPEAFLPEFRSVEDDFAVAKGAAMLSLPPYP